LTRCQQRSQRIRLRGAFRCRLGATQFLHTELVASSAHHIQRQNDDAEQAEDEGHVRHDGERAVAAHGVIAPSLFERVLRHSVRPAYRDVDRFRLSPILEEQCEAALRVERRQLGDGAVESA